MATDLAKGPSFPGHFPHLIIFSVLPSKLTQKGSTRLRSSQLSFSTFNALGSSPSYICPLCCISASLGGHQPFNHATSSWGGPAGIPSLFNLALLAPPLSMHRPHTTLSPTNNLLFFCPLHNSSLCTCLGFWLFFTYSSLSLPRFNQGFSMECQTLQARSAELLHFISLYSVLMSIQESNLNSSSSFRIPG